jgi:hypothetical protein
LLLVWAVRSSNGNRVRFGRKLKLAPTVQIKHQLLLRWLADQTQKEAAEANVAIKTAAKGPSPEREARVTLMIIATVLSATLALSAALLAGRHSNII